MKTLSAEGLVTIGARCWFLTLLELKKKNHSNISTTIYAKKKKMLCLHFSIHSRRLFCKYSLPLRPDSGRSALLRPTEAGFGHVTRLVVGGPYISVLVCSGCCNQIPGMGSWKTIEIYFSQFWRLQVQDQGADILGSGKSCCRVPTDPVSSHGGRGQGTSRDRLLKGETVF